jgi:hypothetical protein
MTRRYLLGLDFRWRDTALDEFCKVILIPIDVLLSHVALILLRSRMDNCDC